MKPAPFAYHAAASLDEALRLLAAEPDETKVIAGGQSLVPMMSFRLARPERLLDIGSLAELRGIAKRDGALLIGATTPQAVLERSRVARDGWPLLTEALGLVAHPQIRNRGTVGGSVAHADPAAELPTAFVALDARMHVRSSAGERTIPAEEFFVAPLMSALAADELLVRIEVPPLAPRTGHAFVEVAQRHGDFALAGVAALVTLGAQERCELVALTLLGVAPTPLRARAVEEWLPGRPWSDTTLQEAADMAVVDVRPTGDTHGSSEYRRALARELVLQALARAGERAR